MLRALIARRWVGAPILKSLLPRPVPWHNTSIGSLAVLQTLRREAKYLMANEKKIHTVYVVVNQINQKFYIGYHSTTNPNDDYLGSGVQIRRAVRKYGRANFKKHVVFVSDSELEALEYEAEVLRVHLESPDCYNIVPGGRGGPAVGRLGALAMHQKYTKEDRSGWASESSNPEKSRIAMRELNQNGHKFFHGKTHSIETKALMSKRAVERLAIPSNNSQFGTMWITNGVESKKIKLGSNIPTGWGPGRKMPK